MLTAKQAKNITESYKNEFYKYHSALFYTIEQQITIAAQKGYKSISISKPDFSKEFLMVFINLLKAEGYDCKLVLPSSTILLTDNGERTKDIIISW